MTEQSATPRYSRLYPRAYGVPGASLGDASSLGEAQVAAGIRGELKLARSLESFLTKLDRSIPLYHSMKLKQDGGDIDHVIVTPDRRIILIDAKMWKGGQSYGFSTDQDGTTQIIRDGESFAGGQVHLVRQMREWQDRFPGYRVEGLLVLVQESVTVVADASVPFAVASLSNLDSRLTDLLDTVPADAHLHPAEVASFQGLLAGAERVSTGAEPYFYTPPSEAVSPPPESDVTKMAAWWLVIVLLVIFNGVYSVVAAADGLISGFGGDGLTSARTGFTQVSFWVQALAIVGAAIAAAVVNIRAREWTGVGLVVVGGFFAGWHIFNLTSTIRLELAFGLADQVTSVFWVVLFAIFVWFFTVRANSRTR